MKDSKLGSLPNPLELATNAELVDELKRRHRAILVVMERLPEDGTPDCFESAIAYSGGPNTAMGLAFRARIVIAQHMTLDHFASEEAEDEEGP